MMRHVGGALCPCVTCDSHREEFYRKLENNELVEKWDEDGSSYYTGADPCLGCPLMQDVGDDRLARWTCVASSAEELDNICRLQGGGWMDE